MWPFIWWDSLYYSLPISVVVFLLVTYQIIKVYFFQNSPYRHNSCLDLRNKFGGHSWRSIQSNKSVPYNVLCSACDKLMLLSFGMFCDSCALSGCVSCTRYLDQCVQCRPLILLTDATIQHVWRKVHSGNTACSNHDDIATCEFYCCWCQRTERSCDHPSKNACDFGIYAQIIIPPQFVSISQGGVINIRQPESPIWEPLFILANRKSGSNLGDEVLSLFRGLLNPIQVVDLSVVPPEQVVRWLPWRCRLLVAGGDGSVAWVLNALASSPQHGSTQPVAILPLGTGNDLSRVLGWGATCDDNIDAKSIVRKVIRSKVTTIDRWSVNITSQPRLGVYRRQRTLHAFNYASIGVDAQVALDFHHARSHIYNYTNRTINHILYVCFGIRRGLDEAASRGLERRLSVRLDDAPALVLPPLQALVLLNIPSWGAGVDLWNTGADEQVPKQNYSDGLIEVIGISSSFHIAQLQCGFAQPIRFGQSKRVDIVMTGKCAMQVDGEPWMQGACSVEVRHAGQATALADN